MALGRLDRKYIGTEYAGVVSRISEQADFKVGDRVMLGYINTFKTFVKYPSQYAVEISNCLSFAKAAALPITLTTAYHALHEIARL